MDSYFALAAFAGWILLGFAVAFIVLLIQQCERQEAETKKYYEDFRYQRDINRALHADNEKLRALIKPLDPDGDGRPGGRKRHDPYIDR